MSRKNNNRNNVKQVEVIELGAYTTPQIVEDVRKEFVAYGEDNDFFQFLIDRFTGSSTNNAIITGMSRSIYGKGLEAVDKDEKPLAYAELQKLIKKSCLRKFIADRKMLGMAAFKIKKKNGRVVKVSHFPMDTLRSAKADENGEIKTWLYHHKWSDYSVRDELKAFPSFGNGNGNEEEIYVLKPYVAGHFYYSPVDYQGSLPYAVLEEEIADYLINDTINGFSGTKIVNFNNGKIDDSKRRNEIVNRVKSTMSGSRGQKILVSFNSSSDNKLEIDDIPLNDAPAHYDYLSGECFKKLIVGHRVTSPMLLGVRDGNNGLGNNAEEIKNATLLFDNYVIKSYQEEIIDCISEILEVNGFELDLYFITLEPLEFMDLDNTNGDEDAIEKETGISDDKSEGNGLNLSKSNLDDDISNKLIDLADDDMDGWELIDERDVDYEEEDELDRQIESLNSKEDSFLSKVINFVKTGTARPNSKSEQDKDIDGVQYKVRYRYSPLKFSDNSREFCKKMIRANKLYRKEDIIAMGNQVVNEGWGLNGADTYSIWLYKGGGGCHHKWRRETYKFKGKIKGDVNSPNADKVSTNQSEREGFRVRNPKEVSIRPVDMPNKGFVNK